MAKIADFRCTYDHAVGFGSWISKEHEIQFPQAYREAEMMVRLAKAVRHHHQTVSCHLPFCHTLEAEALGGNIRLGDGLAGPRAGKYACHSLEEVLKLPKMDMESVQAKRLNETLKACRKLKDEGESVIFIVSGPLTILGGLVESEQVFRSFLKQRDLMGQVLEKLSADILIVMKAAEEAGADLISYADPAGGVNLVGPKVAEWIAKTVTVPLLKAADQMLADDMTILLCPKTAFALIGTETAVWKDCELPEPMEYIQAVLYMKKQVRLAGQDCMNHVGSRLENCKLKALRLI